MPRFALFFALLFLVAAPASTFAAELSGTWTFTGSQAELDAREAAIATAADSYPAVFRGIARKSISKSAIVPEQYVIEDRGDTFVMWFDGRTPRETDLVGTPITFRPPDRADFVSLKRERVGAGIKSLAEANSGSIQTEAVRVGEQLRITITLVSDRLPTPLVYSLSYARQ